MSSFALTWIREYDLVLVDRVQIQQVLVNLFRNALEAMAHSPQRELVVSTMPIADDMIEVAVFDTGPGFLMMSCQPVSDLLYDKEAGMGVGLSISRSIIEAHGGRMWAEANVQAAQRFVSRCLPHQVRV